MMKKMYLACGSEQKYNKFLKTYFKGDSLLHFCIIIIIIIIIQ